MKKSLLTAIALLSFAGTASLSASPLSPEAALSTFLTHQQTMEKKVALSRAASYTLEMRGDNNALYVYNSPGGFLVLSSKDGSLLGYGDSRIDADDMAPGLRAVLKALAHSPRRNASGLDAHEEIPMMVTAKWDQDAPYYNDCPYYNNSRCVTGCAATALSQVLYHPSNRMQPHGSYNYLWEAVQGRISFDFDSHPFEYDKMLDVYDANSPEEANAAVANLMYAVGAAINMEYSPNFSGTSDIEAGAGLIRNLGCDRSLRVLNREFYADKEWDNMVYDQLATGHPMVYTGVSKDGGHAFVCDGYQRRDDRNFYHINWGWSGRGDGWFELTQLTPGYLGIGGGESTSGFNMQQTGHFNIKPDEGTPDCQKIFWQFGAMKPDVYTASRRGRVNITYTGNPSLDGGGILSGCLEDTYAVIGFKYINTADNSVQYQELSQPVFFNINSGFTEMMMPCQLFPDKDGTYVCKLAMKVGDEWIDVKEELAFLSDFTVTLDKSNVTIEVVDKGQRLHADFIGFDGNIIKGEPTQLNIEFMAGKEDVDTDVIPAITTNAGKVLWTQSAKHLKLAYGESATLEWDEPFTPNTRRGSYMMTLLDAEGESLITPFKVLVTTSNEVDAIEAADNETGAKTELFTIDGLPLHKDAAPGTLIIKRTGTKSEKIISPR